MRHRSSSWRKTVKKTVTVKRWKMTAQLRRARKKTPNI
jgi:hypothetical protein